MLQKSLSSDVPLKRVDCTFAREQDGSLRRFGTHGRLTLGPSPKVQKLADEMRPGMTHDNPSAADANRYIRAASAVRFLDAFEGDTVNHTAPVRLVVAQDSRRHLGVARLNLSYRDILKNPQSFAGASIASVSMVLADSEANAAAFDSDQRDYASFRKKHKLDLESATTLPGGELLFLGSGSDLLPTGDGTVSHRSTAVILQPLTGTLSIYDIRDFYKRMYQDAAIIGGSTPKAPASLNIEGAALRRLGDRWLLALFHRGNQNNNGYNSMVEFDYIEWRRALEGAASVAPAARAAVWQGVKALRIIHLATPQVTSAGDGEGRAFPITINDALYFDDGASSGFLIPCATEANLVDAAGVVHDGVVTFAGMLRWVGVDRADGGTCEILQAPLDGNPGLPSAFGKIEGLTAFNPQGKSAYERSIGSKGGLVFGVTDLDSETTPSSLSLLEGIP
jgi:hypothetical protein